MTPQCGLSSAQNSHVIIDTGLCRWLTGRQSAVGLATAVVSDMAESRMLQFVNGVRSRPSLKYNERMTESSFFLLAIQQTKQL